MHTARCKETGRKLAVKVQHRGLRETSAGDLLAMGVAVAAGERLFEAFHLGWICEELTPQLPKELDFQNEGRNAEAAAAHLRRTGLDCVVPRVLWEKTSPRVLTMEFEEGFRATDVKEIDKAGISRRQVWMFWYAMKHLGLHPFGLKLLLQPLRICLPEMLQSSFRRCSTHR